MLIMQGNSLLVLVGNQIARAGENCTKTSSPLWRWMKPKPLLALNHFTVPCSLLTALLFSVNRVTAEHNIKLSDAQVPSPSTEPRPSSSFVREDCKAVYRTKKWPQV